VIWAHHGGLSEGREEWKGDDELQFELRTTMQEVSIPIHEESKSFSLSSSNSKNFNLILDLNRFIAWPALLYF
jgi:flagellar biosynthesis regulator FlaF